MIILLVVAIIFLHMRLIWLWFRYTNNPSVVNEFQVCLIFALLHLVRAMNHGLKIVRRILNLASSAWMDEFGF